MLSGQRNPLDLYCEKLLVRSKVPLMCSPPALASQIKKYHAAIFLIKLHISTYPLALTLVNKTKPKLKLNSTLTHSRKIKDLFYLKLSLLLPSSSDIRSQLTLSLFSFSVEILLLLLLLLFIVISGIPIHHCRKPWVLRWVPRDSTLSMHDPSHRRCLQISLLYHGFLGRYFSFPISRSF